MIVKRRFREIVDSAIIERIAVAMRTAEKRVSLIVEKDVFKDYHVGDAITFLDRTKKLLSISCYVIAEKDNADKSLSPTGTRSIIVTTSKRIFSGVQETPQVKKGVGGYSAYNSAHGRAEPSYNPNVSAEVGSLSKMFER